MCEIRGAFLFQVRPDIFPEGYLTETELILWGKYYKERDN